MQKIALLHRIFFVLFTIGYKELKYIFLQYASFWHELNYLGSFCILFEISSVL